MAALNRQFALAAIPLAIAAGNVVAGPIDADARLNELINIPGAAWQTHDGSLLAQSRLPTWGGGEASESWIPADSQVWDLPVEQPVFNSPEYASPPIPPIFETGFRSKFTEIDVGVLYVIDFAEVIEQQLGESIWSVLEIGTDSNNDFVLPDLGLQRDIHGANFDFFGYSSGSTAFVYLSSTDRGMGVCDLPADDEPGIDRSYPGSSQSRCADPDQQHIGSTDRLSLRPDTDVWIREVQFRAASHTDGSLFGNAVGIAEGAYRFSIDKGQAEYVWTPVVPFYVEADTQLQFSRYDEDFVITGLSFYVESAARSKPFFLTLEDSSESTGKGRQLLVAVSEPAALVLLVLSLAMLAGLRHWRTLRQ